MWWVCQGLCLTWTNQTCPFLFILKKTKTNWNRVDCWYSEKKRPQNMQKVEKNNFEWGKTRQDAIFWGNPLFQSHIQYKNKQSICLLPVGFFLSLSVFLSISLSVSVPISLSSPLPPLLFCVSLSWPLAPPLPHFFTPPTPSFSLPVWLVGQKFGVLCTGHSYNSFPPPPLLYIKCSSPFSSNCGEELKKEHSFKVLMHTSCVSAVSLPQLCF